MELFSMYQGKYIEMNTAIYVLPSRFKYPNFTYLPYSVFKRRLQIILITHILNYYTNLNIPTHGAKNCKKRFILISEMGIKSRMEIRKSRTIDNRLENRMRVKIEFLTRRF